MSAPDRLQQLLLQNQVTGIDFIYVLENQVELDVHFFVSPDTLVSSMKDDVPKEKIIIYNPSGGTNLTPVPVLDLRWDQLPNNEYILHITTGLPGDFTLYKLLIEDPRIDPYFNDITFTFKAHCKSYIDCKQRKHECPPEEQIDFPVDYLARDFWSLRRGLLDFASHRYPDWKDRLEADAGIMFVEVMSALGDELAYYQDRIAREAHLETATQRRSVRRHGNLVDYHIHDGLGAGSFIDITVKPGMSGNLLSGMDIWADSENQVPVMYELGRGLEDIIKKRDFHVDALRNNFLPHIWDEDDTCLFTGTTELYIKGHHKDDLPFDDPPEDPTGKWIVLKTNPGSPDIPARRLCVRLITVEDKDAFGQPLQDPVFNEPITRLVWENARALPFEIDLEILEIHGNILPVTAGKEIELFFTIGDPGDLPVPDTVKAPLQRALEREGPNGSVTYLFSLPRTDEEHLVWLGEDPSTAKPEIRLIEVTFDGSEWIENPLPWKWKPALLGIHSSQPHDQVYTLDDGLWKRIVGYQREGKEIIHIDYATGDGKTIRFGDDEFGQIPPEGTVFKVNYRVGNGPRGNVPGYAIKKFDDATGIIEELINPLPINNGMSPQTLESVKKLAPDAFRALTYRAVRPGDYAEAAERLSWVQRAGASFRWTGSWLTAFVTPDPLGSVQMTESQYDELSKQLDRFRQAGREAFVKQPCYANIDLSIRVCVAPFAYKGEVKENILIALLGKKGACPQTGFFSPDNFTFGTSLKRSALEAVIQDVPGVRAVKAIRIRRRGWEKQLRLFSELIYTVGFNEVIRLQNDPLHPEQGSLKLIMEGGA